MQTTGRMAPIDWLLAAPEPWTRYRTRVDLLMQDEADPDVQAERSAMLAHPQVQRLVDAAQGFCELPIRRHNDAGHPLYALSTLADFGLKLDDPGIDALVAVIRARQSPEGAFRSLLNIPTAFGGSGEDQWAWAACDAPTLLYALLALGVDPDDDLHRAIEHLVGLGSPIGWRCVAAPELGKFHGPGRRSDPCPIANLVALKTLSRVPEQHESPSVQAAIEMLLAHWDSAPGTKYYLFGVGSNYRKLKYPFVWYDLLHVADVLSRFSQACSDPRMASLAGYLARSSGDTGRYRATSMYQAWKGWDFADKKNDSPWLTFLVMRILQRIGT